MTTKLHKSLVEELKLEGYSDKGFWKGVLDLLGDEFIKEEFPGKKLLPDAWKIDAESGVVIAVEVIVTNELSSRKLREYVDLWFFLDSYSIDLQLFVKYRNIELYEVSPQAMYYDMLANMVENQKSGESNSLEFRSYDYVVANNAEQIDIS